MAGSSTAWAPAVGAASPERPGVYELCDGTQRVLYREAEKGAEEQGTDGVEIVHGLTVPVEVDRRMAGPRAGSAFDAAVSSCGNSAR